MVSHDLARILKDRYPGEHATESYLDHVRTVVGTATYRGVSLNETRHERFTRCPDIVPLTTGPPRPGN
jgi:hypothetical protein